MSVKETLEALDCVFSLQKAGVKALDDGKFSFMDFPLFFGPVMKLPAAINGAKLIPQELAHLSAEDQEEIKKFVKENFDIPDDALEAKINEGLALVLKIASFIQGV